MWKNIEEEGEENRVELETNSGKRKNMQTFQEMHERYGCEKIYNT